MSRALPNSRYPRCHRTRDSTYPFCDRSLDVMLAEARTPQSSVTFYSTIDEGFAQNNNAAKPRTVLFF